MDGIKTVFEDFVALSEDLNEGKNHYASFVLLYITAETQLRKLITFILRTDPHLIHWNHIKKYIEELGDVNIDFWIKLFDRLHRPGFSAILSRKLAGGKAQFNHLRNEVNKNIKNLRNKLFHGVFIYQENFNDIKVKNCNNIMRQWINSMRDSMKDELGYDGLGDIRPLVKGAKKYRFKVNSPYEEVKNYIETCQIGKR
jgi:hypothetical protein